MIPSSPGQDGSRSTSHDPSVVEGVHQKASSASKESQAQVERAVSIIPSRTDEGLRERKSIKSRNSQSLLVQRGKTTEKANAMKRVDKSISSTCCTPVAEQTSTPEVRAGSLEGAERDESSSTLTLSEVEDGNLLPDHLGEAEARGPLPCSGSSEAQQALSTFSRQVSPGTQKLREMFRANIVEGYLSARAKSPPAGNTAATSSSSALAVVVHRSSSCSSGQGTILSSSKTPRNRKTSKEGMKTTSSSPPPDRWGGAVAASSKAGGCSSSGTKLRGAKSSMETSTRTAPASSSRPPVVSRSGRSTNSISSFSPLLPSTATIRRAVIGHAMTHLQQYQERLVTTREQQENDRGQSCCVSGSCSTTSAGRKNGPLKTTRGVEQQHGQPRTTVQQERKDGDQVEAQRRTAAAGAGQNSNEENLQHIVPVFSTLPSGRCSQYRRGSSSVQQNLHARAGRQRREHQTSHAGGAVLGATSAYRRRSSSGVSSRSPSSARRDLEDHDTTTRFVLTEDEDDSSGRHRTISGRSCTTNPCRNAKNFCKKLEHCARFFMHAFQDPTAARMEQRRVVPRVGGMIDAAEDLFCRVGDNGQHVDITDLREEDHMNVAGDPVRRGQRLQRRVSHPVEHSEGLSRCFDEQVHSDPPCSDDRVVVNYCGAGLNIGNPSRLEPDSSTNHDSRGAVQHFPELILPPAPCSSPAPGSSPILSARDFRVEQPTSSASPQALLLHDDPDLRIFPKRTTVHHPKQVRPCMRSDDDEMSCANAASNKSTGVLAAASSSSSSSTNVFLQLSGREVVSSRDVDKAHLEEVHHEQYDKNGGATQLRPEQPASILSPSGTKELKDVLSGSTSSRKIFSRDEQGIFTGSPGTSISFGSSCSRKMNKKVRFSEDEEETEEHDHFPGTNAAQATGSRFICSTKSCSTSSSLLFFAQKADPQSTISSGSGGPSSKSETSDTVAADDPSPTASKLKPHTFLDSTSHEKSPCCTSIPEPSCRVHAAPHRVAGAETTTVQACRSEPSHLNPLLPTKGRGEENDGAVQNFYRTDDDEERPSNYCSSGGAAAAMASTTTPGSTRTSSARRAVSPPLVPATPSSSPSALRPGSGRSHLGFPDCLFQHGTGTKNRTTTTYTSSSSELPLLPIQHGSLRTSRARLMDVCLFEYNSFSPDCEAMFELARGCLQEAAAGAAAAPPVHRPTVVFTDTDGQMVSRTSDAENLSDRGNFRSSADPPSRGVLEEEHDQPDGMQRDLQEELRAAEALRSNALQHHDHHNCPPDRAVTQDPPLLFTPSASSLRCLEQMS
ncbi:unnamed protein product [Amoebophrya sp. A120]|nr:unnamed protein product [Amoebophrya sp. A120]|eukprot:GSA120T00021928001.1